MNIEQAIEVLEEHNKWRTAKPPYDVCGVRSKHQPSEITEAIDTAVRAMRERVSE